MTAPNTPNPDAPRPVLDYSQSAPGDHDKHIVPEKDRIPVIEKLMYGMGSGSFQLASEGIKGLAMPIFNITLGMSPTLIGLVLMLSRLYDAFTDPIMGKISDDTKSRFGRRRPYIFFGAILTASAFILVWYVPIGWTSSIKNPWYSNAVFIWYLFTMLFFYTCSTIQNVPYHTLGLEMTADHHERTVVSGYKMFFSFCFAVFIPWIFPLALNTTMFPNALVGIRYLSWYIAIAIILGGVLPAFFVKERYYRIASQAAKFPFFKGLKLTFQNKPFLILTGILLTTGIGSNMVSAMGPYVVYYYMYSGDVKVGADQWALASNAFTAGAIISLPLMTWFCSRYGKVNTLKLVVVIGFIGSISKFYLYNKSIPELLYISQILMAPLAAGFWTITTSMKSDICDDDELRNGSRREGMFGAVGNWVTKVTFAFTFLLAGIALEITGFDAGLGAKQDPQSLFWMRILFSTIPAVSNIIAFGLLILYPLNERRLNEIRTELETRRGEVDETNDPTVSGKA
jgi:GPH family glycoside/pentoside/hexuronide:cation symporter